MLCDTSLNDFPVLNIDGPAQHEEGLESQNAQLSTTEYPTKGLESERNDRIYWLVALSYAYLALRTEAEGTVDTDLVQRLTSHAMIDEATTVSKSFDISADADFEDLLNNSIFLTKLASSNTMKVDTSTLTCILMDWLEGSCDNVGASIFANDTKVIVCLKIVTCGVPTYILFDSSPRTEDSSGPSLRRAGDIDQVLLQELLGPCNPGKFLFTYLSRRSRDIEEESFQKNKLVFVKDTFFKSTRCLPQMQGNSFLLRGSACTCYKSIPIPSGAPDARASLEAFSRERVAIESMSNSRPKSRWRDFGWQSSLQTPSPASMDCATDDNPMLSTKLAGSGYEDLSLRNEEPTPPVASTSKSSEMNQVIATRQPPVFDKYSNEDVCETQSVPGSSKDLGRSLVSSGKRASQNSEKEDNWETALLQQLQDEEEIASALYTRSPSEYTWLVTLQKRLQAEEQRMADNRPSTSISPSEIDWQLAVQLQQEEVYQEESLENGTPRIVVESESDNGESPSPLSPSTSQAGRLRVPEQRMYGDSFESLNLYGHAPPEESFQCGVCGDMHRLVDTVALERCSHRFCKECLRRFVQTKIDDRKYPIFCPCCLTERSRTAKTRILQDTIDKLELPSEDQQKFCELEMMSHSIVLECPRCKERMNVDREEYSLQAILVCPLPRCAHKWCRSCLKTVASSEERHRCRNGNIDRLMKRKGWKYCPGCRTPVQKESGCNHMTCGAPGCNVHFCYKCGVSMIDTTNGGDVGTAVTEHYNDCRLFERRLKCTIQ